jgi:hypothetical protein
MKNKPTKFPLPEPIELAKLAAILRPQSQATSALNAAMQFYVEAVRFCGELPSTLEELVVQFGSDERRKEVQIQALRVIRDSDDKLVMPEKKLLPEVQIQACANRDSDDQLVTPEEKLRMETFELQLTPAVHEDAARQYLRKQGWDGSLKNPGTVLTNIRRYWQRIAKYSMHDLLDSADQFIAKQTRTQNGRTICDLPRLMLENMVELQKRKLRGSKLTSYHVHKGKAALKKSGKKNLKKFSV